MTTTLSPADRTFLEAEGYLALKSFYDVAHDSAPIQVAEQRGVNSQGLGG